MSPENQRLLEADLKVAEGFRKKAYRDSVGVWTIGYGTNLQELEISQDLALEWLRLKIAEAESECHKWSFFSSLSPVRQRALVELVYNMGFTRFNKFKHTLAAIERGDFTMAAIELENSLWAKQVGPARANRIIRMIEHDAAS